MNSAFQSRDDAVATRRPPAVLHLGVVGGSSTKPVDLVTVEAVMAEISAAARETVAASHDLYAGPTVVLRCISSLASSEARSTVRHALKCGFSLQVPLPRLPQFIAADLTDSAERADFEQLLTCAEVTGALQGTPSSGEELDAALLDVILDQSDLLLILGDGVEAARLAREARARSIPVFELGSFGVDGIRFEGPGAAGDWRRDVRAAIATLLDPFQADDPELRAVLRRLPSRFFNDEAKSPGWYLRIHTMFERMVLIGWSAPRSKSPPAMASEPHEPEGLAPDFAWVDRLAVRYAHVYRSAFVLRYLLIMPMAIGMTVGFFAATALVRTIGFGVQLLAVVGTLALTLMGKRTDWHERFTSYRLLAELLRHQLYVGRLGRTLRTPYGPADRDSVSSVWVSWQFRAFVRRDGLRAMDQPAVDPSLIMTALRSILEGQGHFYRSAAARYGTIANRVWKGAVWLFWIDFAIITVRGAVIGLMRTAGMAANPSIGFVLDWSEDSLNELDIMLPSIAWIILALGDQGEYARLGEQYASMAERAAALLAELERVDCSYPDVARLALETAAVLTSEVSSWRLLVAARVISYL